MTHLQYIFLFLVLNFGALAIGSYFMNNGPTSSWYLSLNKAPWTPPGWVFGVAWTTIMVCFSVYLSYLIGLKNNNIFWLLFSIQFILNTSWNFVFFNQHLMGFGLVIISLLTLLIGYYLFKFYSEMGIKSWLIVPYFLWLLIATSLNGYSYLKN